MDIIVKLSMKCCIAMTGSFYFNSIFTDDVYVSLVADRVDGLHRINMASYYKNAFTKHKKNLVFWRTGKEIFYHNANIQSMYALWYIYCSTYTCTEERVDMTNLG